MKRILTVATILLATVLMFACSQSGQFDATTSTPPTEAVSRESVEEALIALHAEWAKAELSRDTSALDRILAADFLYTREDGRATNKQEYIAEVQNSTDVLSTAENRNVKLRAYGNEFAVATGDFYVAGTGKDGKDIDGISRWTNVSVKRNGSWQAVAGHNSWLPTKR